MAINLALLGIFSGIAVATSFFLSFFLMFIKKRDRYINNLLGLMFLAVGFRIGKSIAYFIFIDVKAIGLALGFLGLSSVGPLFFLYIRAVENKEIVFSKKDTLHFIIPFLGVFVCLFTHLGHITILYKSVTALFFIYLVISARRHFQFNYEKNNNKQWNTHLLVVLCIIWMSFVLQHLTPNISKYAMGTGVASLAIYYIFIYALKSPVVFSKPKNKTLPDSTIEKVKYAFENDKIYLKQGITITQFAKDYSIPAYLVTESVKQLYGKRFPEAINYFRIENIKKVLMENDKELPKIEVLAYEVGFNTPSTFYAAFKKETNMSPKEFQKEHLSYY